MVGFGERGWRDILPDPASEIASKLETLPRIITMSEIVSLEECPALLYHFHSK